MTVPEVEAFLEVVAHDLRAPVASVRTMISLLSQGYVGTLQPSQAELVGRIESRLASLQALVDGSIDRAWLRVEQDAVPGAPAGEGAAARPFGPDAVLRLVRAAAAACGGTVEIQTTDGVPTIIVRLPRALGLP